MIYYYGLPLPITVLDYYITTDNTEMLEWFLDSTELRHSAIKYLTRMSIKYERSKVLSWLLLLTGPFESNVIGEWYINAIENDNTFLLSWLITEGLRPSYSKNYLLNMTNSAEIREIIRDNIAD